MARTSKRLGQLLIARGWLTGSALERALATQSLVGGHLGTCLLELDLVTEDQLGRGLSQLHGLPAASAEDLRNVRDEVIALIPKRLAARHGAVPFRLLGNRLDVAMVDIGNLTSWDELSFASGKRINAHVAPEARVLEALDRYYDQESPPRITRLVDRLNRRRFLWSGEGGRPAADGGWSDPAVELFPASPEILLPSIPEPDLGGAPAHRAAPTVPTGWPPSAGRDAVEAPLTTAEAAARIAAAGDREEIGGVVIAYLLQSFNRVGLFAMRSDRVTGWTGGGDGFKADRLADFSLPLIQPSIFHNLRRGSSLHFGLLAPMPGHRKLAACWGNSRPPECLIAPVRIGNRMVAALYADRGPDPLGGVDLEQIQLLTERIAAALERCIILKKQRQTSAQRR